MKPDNHKSNQKYSTPSFGIALGISVYLLGSWWDNYTFSHSPNPRIDFNFAAAFVSMGGIILAISSLVWLIVTYYNNSK